MTRNPWPWPGDTPLQRARRLAIAYRQHLKTANPDVCAALDEATAAYGETWLVEQPTLVPADQHVTTAEAAALAGVQPGTIHKWRRRGIRWADGTRRTLPTTGLSPEGWPMYSTGAVLQFAATARQTRLHRRSPHDPKSA